MKKKFLKFLVRRMDHFCFFLTDLSCFIWDKIETIDNKYELGYIDEEWEKMEKLPPKLYDEDDIFGYSLGEFDSVPEGMSGPDKKNKE